MSTFLFIWAEYLKLEPGGSCGLKCFGRCVIKTKLQFISNRSYSTIQLFLIEHTKKTAWNTRWTQINSILWRCIPPGNMPSPSLNYCDICNVKFTSGSHAQSHYDGKRHAKQTRFVDQDRRDDYVRRCNICDVDFTSGSFDRMIPILIYRVFHL